MEIITLKNMHFELLCLGLCPKKLPLITEKNDSLFDWDFTPLVATSERDPGSSIKADSLSASFS